MYGLYQSGKWLEANAVRQFSETCGVATSFIGPVRSEHNFVKQSWLISYHSPYLSAVAHGILGNLLAKPGLLSLSHCTLITKMKSGVIYNFTLLLQPT